jgi:hypothetical protein
VFQQFCNELNLFAYFKYRVEQEKQANQTHEVLKEKIQHHSRAIGVDLGKVNAQREEDEHCENKNANNLLKRVIFIFRPSRASIISHDWVEDQQLFTEQAIN